MPAKLMTAAETTSSGAAPEASTPKALAFEMQRASHEGRPNDRLDALTSLRFFAAFAIVIQHSRGIFLPQDFLGSWLLDQAVSFFFVLSGFILFHVYQELPDRRTVAGFWLARVARIWPMHLLAFAVLMALAHNKFQVSGSDSTATLTANLLLVQAWIPSRAYYFSFNALSWTVSTELAFYLLFPLLIHRFRSTWPLKLLCAAGLLIGLTVICEIWQLPGYRDGYDGVTTHGLMYINPGSRLFEFVLGMCIGLWGHRFRPHPGSHVLLWTGAELLALGLMLWNVRYGVFYLISWTPLGLVPAVREWLLHAGGCLSFAVLIWVMAGEAGLIGRWLRLRPLVFLGEISYAIYMLHQVIITGYVMYWTPEPPLAVSWPWLIFVTFLLAVAAAAFFAVEQPARRAIKKLSPTMPQQRPSKLGPAKV
jgi:peptidoglycan/LPS O-acetylase OafA/YrhL